MATALLFNGNDLLMMKRSLTRTLSPGKWAAVGGHLEPHELNDPRQACIREVYEETGFREEELQDLRLQYVLIRLNGNEIRQQYFYTAHVTRRDVLQTEEGDLHWIPREEALDRDIPFIFRKLLEHYLANGAASHAWVGTAGLTKGTSGEPTIHWVPMVDPGTI